MNRLITNNPIRQNLRTVGLTLAVSSASFGGAVLAQDQSSSERTEVYQPGNQFTASYFQSTREWLLTPMEGPETTVSAADLRCAGSAQLPRGVWLLTIDTAGRAMLVAPSVTEVLEGQPDHVTLVPCGGGKPLANTLNVPMPLIDWLASTSGAVWVE